MNYSDSDSSLTDGGFDSDLDSPDLVIGKDYSITLAREDETLVDINQNMVEDDSQVDETEALKPRSYQLEMLEKSLEKNIIVAVSIPFSLRISLASMLICHSRWTLEVERLKCDTLLEKIA
jgi:hypothetical protein